LIIPDYTNLQNSAFIEVKSVDLNLTRDRVPAKPNDIYLEDEAVAEINISADQAEGLAMIHVEPDGRQTRQQGNSLPVKFETVGRHQIKAVYAQGDIQTMTVDIKPPPMPTAKFYCPGGSKVMVEIQFFGRVARTNMKCNGAAIMNSPPVDGKKATLFLEAPPGTKCEGRKIKITFTDAYGRPVALQNY
jgi:hypothetical protein